MSLLEDEGDEVQGGHSQILQSLLGMLESWVSSPCVMRNSVNVGYTELFELDFPELNRTGSHLSTDCIQFFESCNIPSLPLLPPNGKAL